MFRVLPSSASKGLKFSLFRNWPDSNPNWQFWGLRPVYVLFRESISTDHFGSLQAKHTAFLTSHMNPLTVPFNPCKPISKAMNLGLHLVLTFAYNTYKHQKLIPKLACFKGCLRADFRTNLGDTQPKPLA